MNKKAFFSGSVMALLGLMGLAVSSHAKQAHSQKTGHAGKPHSIAVSKSAGSSAGSTEAQIWHPDPKLLDQLAPASSIGGYSVQAPSNYVYTVTKDGGLTGYGWKGPAHPNGISPAFYITTIVVPPDQIDLTLTHAFASEQKSQRSFEPDVTFSAAEFGLVNGLSFIRAYWKGHDTQGVMRHGIYYATIDGQTVSLIGGQDIEPYNSVSLPIMEAASLTFHKNPSQ